MRFKRLLLPILLVPLAVAAVPISTVTHGDHSQLASQRFYAVSGGTIRERVQKLGLFNRMSWNTPKPGAQATSAPQPAMTLPLAAVGAKNPELIPDALAYRHFLKAVATPTNATSDRLKVRDAVLAGLSLSVKDREALISSTSGVWEKLRTIEDARTISSGRAVPSAAVLADLKRQEVEALRDATANLRRALSDEGRLRFDTYILGHVKARISIYGAIPQNLPPAY